jgi:oligopeptidase A
MYYMLTARRKGDEKATAEAGPWVFTLDMPSYIPVQQYAKNRELREKVYRCVS